MLASTKYTSIFYRADNVPETSWRELGTRGTPLELVVAWEQRRRAVRLT
jgi:hypothetical protein